MTSARRMPRLGSGGVPWPEILGACAADLDGPPVLNRMLFEHVSDGSRVVAFEAESKGRQGAYVAKIPKAGSSHVNWNPRREYDALVALHEANADGAWSVVPPVACVDDPPMLVTRYVPGRTVKHDAERGLYRWTTKGQLAQTLRYCELLAGIAVDIRACPVPPPESEPRTSEWWRRFLDDRFRDLADHQPRNAAVVRGLPDWIDRYFDDIWHTAGSDLDQPRPCHGDLSFQNILLEPDGSAHLVDLEGFKFEPHHLDYAKVRFRFEHKRLNPLLSGGRINHAWRAFHDRVAMREPLQALLISYLLALLALLAWAGHPGSRTMRGSRWMRLRRRLWTAGRYRWLSAFEPGRSLEWACHRLTNRL